MNHKRTKLFSKCHVAYTSYVHPFICLTTFCIVRCMWKGPTQSVSSCIRPAKTTTSSISDRPISSALPFLLPSQKPAANSDSSSGIGSRLRGSVDDADESFPEFGDYQRPDHHLTPSSGLEPRSVLQGSWDSEEIVGDNGDDDDGDILDATKGPNFPNISPEDVGSDVDDYVNTCITNSCLSNWVCWSNRLVRSEFFYERIYFTCK